MTRLKKILFIFAATFTILVSVSVALVYVYEDEIKQLALENIGEHLTSDLNMESMDLSIWKRFPLASLECKNLLLDEVFEQGDTLIFAETLYLEFDIFDLAKGDYSVKKVSLEEANIYLKRYPEGENYLFWKSSPDSTTSNFTFDLNEVNLEDTRIVYDDKINEIYTNSFLENGKVEGTITEDEFNLMVGLDVGSSELIVSQEEYLEGQGYSISFHSKINPENENYQFDNGNLEFASSHFDWSASFAEEEPGLNMDINVTSSDLDLAGIQKNLPDFVRKELAVYQVKGEGACDVQISGVNSKKLQPKVEGHFDITSGEMLHLETGAEMVAIQFVGDYKRDANGNDQLKLDSFMADLDQGSINGSVNLVDLKSPDVSLDLKGQLDIYETIAFFSKDSDIDAYGNIVLDARFKGKLPNWDISSNILETSVLNGTVNVSDAKLNNALNGRALSEINGSFVLNNNDVEVSELLCRLDNTEMTFSGDFDNFIPWLLVPEETLKANAAFSSPAIDLQSLLASDQSDASSEPYFLKIPKKVNLNLKASIGNIEFREFEASEASGEIVLKNGKLEVNPLVFKTAGGTVNSKVWAIESGREELEIGANAKLDHIDVRSLFNEFENFGQDFLVAANLKGSCTANGDFKAHMDRNLNIISKSIESDIDVRIDNGELIELSSMQHISNYLRDNRMLAPFAKVDEIEKGLKHIHFATLENSIKIKNEVITIPKMEIKSSAMDITADGTHSFENFIDYTLGFYIRDIMNTKGDGIYAEVEDDGLGGHFFLSMSGSTDDPEFGYDRVAHREHRKEERKKGTEELKEIIKEEFSFRKNKKTDTQEDSKIDPDGGIVIQVGNSQEEPTEKDQKKKRFFKVKSKKLEEGQEIIPEFEEDDDF